jgi:hypothetical protein
MNAPAQQKEFSRDFFDRQDPTEGIGELIIPFSFSSIYDEVDKDSKLSEICAELYDKVLAKLKSGDLGKDVQVDVIDYKDAKQGGKESPRKYLAITRETNRKTRITILARFLPYGNKLYVGVDSFVLGNTNWLKIIGTIALTLLPFICYLFTFLPAIIQNMVSSLTNPFGGGGQSSDFGQTFLLILQYTCCCVFPWLIFAVMFFWLNTVRNFRHEGNLLLGLRQSFNQILNIRSFNIDDILMTLKSVLPLILSSIREVFEKHDLPVKSLDEFAASIQTINNIQNVYGSGNAVAGAGGRASVSRPK